ncbi:MAG: SHOCT domain-containing protein [Pandoraea sp.]|uniref:SHOCT domain-containing protein n=1 Tax=Pandoraea sp. TaxID=1883445 RepID=UPI00122A3A9F|nr:SHOCT domain-containing protein [Pandoraea sp.]TAM17563.1 MAG: SHOCT domain-containing protein [Pandoraea sp.]
MGLGTLFVILVVLVVIGAVAQVALTSSKRKSIAAHIDSLPGFKATQTLVGCDGRSAVAIDESQGSLLLLTMAKSGLSARMVPYSALLSVELFEDGSTVTRTARASQLSSAVVGGLLFGGVGAVVGGLTGKTKSSHKVRRIDLRLVVDDTVNPLHDVALLDAESNQDGIVYQHAMHQARTWCGLLEIAIKRADEEDAASGSYPCTSAQPTSVADEIRKLGELLQVGFLTAEEFSRQKARLLAGPSADVPGSYSNRE